METKKLRVKESKLQQVLDFESNFGWTTHKIEGKTVILCRDIDKKYKNKIRKVEEKVKKLKHFFPWDSLIWGILLGGFIFMYFYLPGKIDFSFINNPEVINIINTYFPYLILLFVGIFGIGFIIHFFKDLINLITKKKKLNRLFDIAKNYASIYCLTPISPCMKQDGQDSGVLASMNL